MDLVEILDDSQGLDQGLPGIFKCRDQTLWIDPAVIGLRLIVAPEMDRDAVVGEPLEIEGNADAERRG